MNSNLFYCDLMSKCLNQMYTTILHTKRLYPIGGHYLKETGNAFDICFSSPIKIAPYLLIFLMGLEPKERSVVETNCALLCAYQC